MFTLFLIIYLLTISLCLSSYAFYPVVIWVVGKIFPMKVSRADINPHISIIIPAYNEEKSIERKIMNTLALEYPEDRIEILVGSDGSIDETASIVGKYTDRGVQLLDFETNRGKTAVQNDLVSQSKGEILIFTDSASFLQTDAIKKIVWNFADQRIGCVAGRMRFVDTDSNLTTQSQGFYWRYEFKLREIESSLGSLIGVDGPLYAVRRESYVLLENNIISDLLTPLLVLEQGKKVVLEPEALVDENPTLKTSQEFATRRRITLRGLVGLSAYIELLNPLKHPFLSFQILFHKILRWFVGPLMILNVLACCSLLGHWFFNSILVVYILFFLAAGLGWGADKLKIKAKGLTVPYYFSLVNFAATMGIIDFFRKKQAVTWKTVRD
jgi:cellulose synthase/poly-beta-1,6-N-acetylglucosamine synthase-like glycosyltransferase